jgi:putative membrane protein
MDSISMFAAVTIMALAGTFMGTFTGLVPGIHVNNVAFLVATAQVPLVAFLDGLLGPMSPTNADLVIILSAAVISAVIAHTFLNFIPSVFLGAPEGETALSVLPGHRMLMSGRGLEAVAISAKGSLVSVVVCALVAPAIRWFMGDPVYAFERMRPVLPILLLTIAALMILTERGGLEAPRALSIKGAVLTAGSITPVRKGSPATLEKGTVVRPGNVIDHPGREITVRGIVGEILPDGLVLEGSGTVKVLADAGLKKGRSVGEKVRVVGRVGIVVDWRPSWRKRLWAGAVFVLSGILGIILLSDTGMATHLRPPIPQAAAVPGMQLLLPLFTGLFGLPTMILSLMRRSGIPKQDPDATIHLDSKEQIKAVLAGTAAGGLVGWYPGVTSAQASVLAVLLVDGQERSGTSVAPMSRTRRFILSISAINTANAIFNIVALFTLLRARSGALKAVQGILGDALEPWGTLASPPQVMLFLMTSVGISAAISYVLTIRIGKGFAKIFDRIPYRKMALAIIISLVLMVAGLGGLLGLAVAGIATCLGAVPPLVGVRRVHLMGCILIPIILTLSGIEITELLPTFG